MIRTIIAFGTLFALTVAGVAVAADTPPIFDTKWGSNGPDEGQFSGPLGIATDASGNVYVADTGNDRIQKFTSAGAFLTEWGTFGSDEGQFHHPSDVATDASGNVYVVDAGNDRIQKFTSDGTFLTKWGSNGSGEDEFHLPMGIATDSHDDVHVADYHNQRIQKFDSSGNFLATWGGAFVDFISPMSVAIDSGDNFYVVDNQTRIQKFDSSGNFLTEWGSSGSGPGRFNGARRVAIDSHDNVYIADSFNYRIQKFDSAGAFINEWGSFGDGDGQFSEPWGIATDASDNVYVADSGNHRMQKFVPAPAGDPEGECEGTEGVELDARLTHGPDPVAANESATWTVELVATACEDVLDVSAQGGTPAWADTDASTDDGDITVRKQKAKSEVLVWDIGSLSAGEVATATLDVSGTTGRKAACDSVVQLSGDWSVTATAAEPGASPTKYDHAEKVGVTIGGDAC
jgi:hypothetical protein